jgi:hypothetical protein
MNIKQTIRTFSVGALVLMATITIAFTTPVSAECGGVDTALINCSQTGGGGVENSGLWGILLIVINVMTAGVGVLALAGIVYGAVLYTSAGGSSEQIKKARTIFTNVVIGVLAFAGMYTLLQFIVPGGVFN